MMGQPGQGGVAPEGAGGGHLAGHGGGGHLAARHAVDGVVHEDDRDLLAAVGRVDRLCHADGGQVAVALVGEDHELGPAPLDARGHGHGAAVGGLVHVAVEVVVGEHRAAHGGHPHRPLPDAQAVDGLRHEAVDRAVGAPGAVVEGLLRQRLGDLGGLALVLHLDGRVGADEEAEPAARALLGVLHVGVEVPLGVDLLGHGEDVRRAGADAQPATLAAVPLNVDGRHSELLSQPTLKSGPTLRTSGFSSKGGFTTGSRANRGQPKEAASRSEDRVRRAATATRGRPRRDAVSRAIS